MRIPPQICKDKNWLDLCYNVLHSNLVKKEQLDATLSTRSCATFHSINLLILPCLSNGVVLLMPTMHSNASLVPRPQDLDLWHQTLSPYVYQVGPGHRSTVMQSAKQAGLQTHLTRGMLCWRHYCACLVGVVKWQVTAVGVSESTKLLKDLLDCWRINLNKGRISK